MMEAVRNGAWSCKGTPYIMFNQGAVRIPRSEGWHKIEFEFTNEVGTESLAYLCGFSVSAYQYYDYRGGSVGAENWLGYTGRLKTKDGKRHLFSVESLKEGTIDGVIVRPGWKLDFSNSDSFFVGFHRIGGVDIQTTWIGKNYGVSVYDVDGVLLSKYVPDKTGNLRNEQTGELLTKVGTIYYGEERRTANGTDGLKTT